MRKVLSLLGLFFFLSLPAGAQEYQQDVNFFKLQVAQPVHTGKKIEVLELFWYRCPHCYELEPYLNKWLKNKPEFVEFVRLPAILNRSWAFDARVYYTFVALGLEDRLHDAYFEAIHEDRKRFRTAEQVADWVAEQRRRKWRWAGHVMRRTDSRWSRRIVQWLPLGGQRRPGRPTTRWEDALETFANRLGFRWENEALDQKDWKRWEATFVETGR